MPLSNTEEWCATTCSRLDFICKSWCETKVQTLIKLWKAVLTRDFSVSIAVNGKHGEIKCLNSNACPFTHFESYQYNDNKGTEKSVMKCAAL